MEYILECMSISVKGMLGMFFWICLSFLISICFVLCGWILSLIFGKKGKKEDQKKPPYTGKPIIITGRLEKELNRTWLKKPKGEGDES